MLKSTLLTLLLAGCLAAAAFGPSARRAGAVPLTDGPGLYAPGDNMPSTPQAIAATAAAAGVLPRTAADLVVWPDWSKGRAVLLVLGFSNVALEGCARISLTSSPPCTPESFVGQWTASTLARHAHFTVFTGAIGGQATADWIGSRNYDTVKVRLAKVGLVEGQVAAGWMKIAAKHPTDTLTDVDALVRDAGAVVRMTSARYPNMRLLYVSSRTYGGYSLAADKGEPYAYRTGLAVRALIAAQSRQRATAIVDSVAGDLLASAPVLLWGPYLWADGTTARADGLTWLRSDFVADGVHPSPAGVRKVGAQLVNFFATDPFASCWFLAAGC